MKYVWNQLQQKLDGVTHFWEQSIVENFKQKVENEEVPEGVIVLENLNFRREEWAYEKPEQIPEPVVEVKEEVKEEEPDFKKMNAKEKKEWEAA